MCGFETEDHALFQSHMTEHRQWEQSCFSLHCCVCGHSTNQEAEMRGHMETHLQGDAGDARWVQGPENPFSVLWQILNTIKNKHFVSSWSLNESIYESLIWFESDWKVGWMYQTLRASGTDLFGSRISEGTSSFFPQTVISVKLS